MMALASRYCIAAAVLLLVIKTASCQTTGFSPVAAAETIRKAIRGLGTNEKAVIDTLCDLNVSQVMAVRQSYAQQYKDSLIDKLEDDFEGDMEKAVLGLAMTPAEFDAYNIHEALSGPGTDEDVLIVHLVHRNNSEIQNITAAYQARYKKFLSSNSLLSAIKDDFHGDTQDFFVSLLKNDHSNKTVSQAELNKDVTDLYNAGRGRWFGTNEDTFIDIITRSGPDYIRDLNQAYGKKYGDTLKKAASKELKTGTLSKCITALLTDPDEWYADRIEKSVKGLGTDEDVLLRIILSRREHLSGINNMTMKKYKQSLANRVEEDTTGDMERLLVCVIKHFE